MPDCFCNHRKVVLQQKWVVKLTSTPPTWGNNLSLFFLTTKTLTRKWGGKIKLALQYFSEKQSWIKAHGSFYSELYSSTIHIWPQKAHFLLLPTFTYNDRNTHMHIHTANSSPCSTPKKFLQYRDSGPCLMLCKLSIFYYFFHLGIGFLFHCFVMRK